MAFQIYFKHNICVKNSSNQKAYKQQILETYLMLLSTCLTQLWSPSSIVTGGDLNPSLEMRLIFARRFAPSPLATTVHSWSPKLVKSQQIFPLHILVRLQQSEVCSRLREVPIFFHSGRVKQLSPSRMRSPCRWKLRGRSALSSSIHLWPWDSNSSWSILSTLFPPGLPFCLFDCSGDCGENIRRQKTYVSAAV